MHFQLKKTITHVSVLTALLPTLPALVSTAIAHERPGPAAKMDPARAPQRGTYTYDTPSSLVRSGVTRECVTTGMWTVDGAVPDCHPEFFTGSSAAAAPATSSASAASTSGGGGAAPKAAAVAVPVAAAASAAKMDPAQAPKRGAYAYDSLTRNVRTAVTGECVKTGTWTPQGATPDCHPDLFAVPQTTSAPAPAPEPQAAAPAPAPAPQAEAAPAAPAEAAAPPAQEVDSVADFQPEGDDPNMLPVPAAEDSAAADDTISDPTMFYDEQEGVANADGVSEPKQFNDEPMATESSAPAVAAVVEEPAANDQPQDEPARDDTVTALKEEEQAGAQNDESVVATQDDGIVGRKEFTEDEAPMATPVEESAPATADSGANDAAAAAPAEPPAPEQPAAEAPAPEQPAAEAPAQEQAAAEAPAQEQPAAEPAPAAPAQEAAPATAQAEPEKPAPAAAAEPKPVILPVTVTLGAEALFDFDRSKVRKGDSTKLDDLVGKLSGVNYDNILVVGHADRIGTKTYNQRLSERRAGAVKNYLANKGVDPKVIKTEGRGELEPTTDAATCKKMAKKKLIDCLQPDRRVEVTVTGKSDQK